MKDSEICLRAAKRVASGHKEYSCNAIAPPSDDCPLVREYTKLFSPTIKRLEIAWLIERFEDKEKAKQWRVLALLFFHEMLKSEGR